MTSWIFFGLGMLMMACTLIGYACIYVGSQSDPEEIDKSELKKGR